MPSRKVLHPPAQDRIDANNHLCDGPGPMISKSLLEHAQQRRPLLALRGIERHPSAATTANPTELKAEKSEVLALREVDPSTLVLIHLDMELGKLFAQPLLHCRTKPPLSRMCVHQHDEIISEARVFDTRPPILSGDGFRSLQHEVDLGEVDVAEQGRNHATLRNALSARRLENQSQEPQHRVVPHPTSHL